MELKEKDSVTLSDKENQDEHVVTDSSIDFKGVLYKNNEKRRVATTKQHERGEEQRKNAPGCSGTKIRIQKDEKSGVIYIFDENAKHENVDFKCGHGPCASYHQKVNEKYEVNQRPKLSVPALTTTTNAKKEKDRKGFEAPGKLSTNAYLRTDADRNLSKNEGKVGCFGGSIKTQRDEKSGVLHILDENTTNENVGFKCTHGPCSLYHEKVNEKFGVNQRPKSGTSAIKSSSTKEKNRKGFDSPGKLFSNEHLPTDGDINISKDAGKTGCSGSKITKQRDKKSGVIYIFDENAKEEQHGFKCTQGPCASYHQKVNEKFEASQRPKLGATVKAGNAKKERDRKGIGAPDKVSSNDYLPIYANGNINTDERRAKRVVVSSKKKENEEVQCGGCCAGRNVKIEKDEKSGVIYIYDANASQGNNEFQCTNGPCAAYHRKAKEKFEVNKKNDDKVAVDTGISMKSFGGCCSYTMLYLSISNVLRYL